MVTRKRLYAESCHFLELAGILYKYDQFHTTLEGLSRVCAELETTSSKNNKMLEINVLQNLPRCSLDETGIKLGQIWQRQRLS